jgi:hypothetical protein
VISLKIFDLNGREIRTLTKGRWPAGAHEVQFDGSDLASGLYLYRLVAGDAVMSRKLMLVK